MNRRRLLLFFTFVLLAGSFIGELAPRPDQAVKPDLPPGSAAAGSGAGGSDDGTVRGTLPRDDVVRARVGDLVELTVTATAPDSASIAGLGLTEALAPRAPAQFSFLADRPGSYPVTLTLTGERAGRVLVEKPDTPPSAQPTTPRGADHTLDPTG